MTTIVLDSSPTVPIRIPDEVHFNVSPAYRGRKLRGQPLLGQGSQTRYSHFVPMGDASPSIKKLLEIPESDNSAMEPIEGYKEILKEEKYINEDKAGPPARVFDSEFRDTAKDYLNTPSNEKMDEYPPNNEAKATPVGDKSTANLANIVAIAQSASSKTKTMAQPKTKSKSKPKPKSKPTKKKKQNRRPSTAKKMTTFKILRKNK